MRSHYAVLGALLAALPGSISQTTVVVTVQSTFTNTIYSHTTTTPACCVSTVSVFSTSTSTSYTNDVGPIGASGTGSVTTGSNYTNIAGAVGATGITSGIPLSSVLSAVGLTSVLANASTAGTPVPFSNENPLPVTPVTTGSAHTVTPTFTSVPDGEFIDWRTYKSNGVNLGAWLAKEKTHDPIWWDMYSPETEDEWHFCESLGSQCGPILEARYASFLNESTIDQLASVGVNTLRIPTTYAAWVVVPGSQLYHGNQSAFLAKIADYAITNYDMHVIIDLHSLPGGVNSLDIGEAQGHDAWFNNATNLAYSYDAVSAVVDFIANSGHIASFTIAPLNEAANNLSAFGTPNGLNTDGSDWVLTYINGVFNIVDAVDSRIPVMMQDCFKGASFWAPLFNTSRNLVFDSHVYYFAAAGSYALYVPETVCGQASYLNSSETKFPTFVGEWSLQVLYNNSFVDRKSIFDTQRYAWAKYVSGGAFWTAVSYSNTTVDGEGIQEDYWSYTLLIDQGVITNETTESFCS